jgi:hypothetical protein
VSQRCVERVIGRLLTDDEFRERYAVDPVAALLGPVGYGLELTEVEIRALACLDLGAFAACADGVDPRLRKFCVPKGV